MTARPLGHLQGHLLTARETRNKLNATQETVYWWGAESHR